MWTEHAARLRYEGCTAFPVRDRRDTERDWSLLVLENPDSDTVLAFFDTPMLEGEGSATALVAKLEAAGAHVGN